MYKHEAYKQQYHSGTPGPLLQNSVSIPRTRTVCLRALGSEEPPTSIPVMILVGVKSNCGCGVCVCEREREREVREREIERGRERERERERERDSRESER